MNICRDTLSIVLDYLQIDDCMKLSFTNKEMYKLTNEIFEHTPRYSEMILSLQLCSKLELYVPHFLILAGYPQMIEFLITRELSTEFYQRLVSVACLYAYYPQVEFFINRTTVRPTVSDLCHVLRFEDEENQCTLEFFKKTYSIDHHYNDTPLLMEHAAGSNRIDIIEFLANEHGIPLDHSIQYRAALRGHHKLLIELNNLGLADWSHSALWLAASGFIEEAEELESLGAPLDDLDTLMREAASMGSIEGIRFGLSRGASFNHCLRFAIYECHIELCDFLVSAGHPVNRDTYFACAVESNDPLMVYWCRNNNVPSSPSTMTHACSKGQRIMVEALLDLNIEFTPAAIHAAMINKHFDLLKWLMSEIYFGDEQMYNHAAECSAVSGSVEFMDFLYTNGSNTFRMNPDPILLMAQIHNNLIPDATQLLIMHGFNINMDAYIDDYIDAEV